MHRFVWDLREPAPHSFAEDLPISAVAHDTPRVPEGPLVVPGRYVVTLDADGVTSQRRLTVIMDPRVSMSPAALREQYALSRRLTGVLNRSYRDAESAKSAGKAKAEQSFTSINLDAAQLLDTIGGVDAQPTSQAVAAAGALSARLDDAERPAR
jgi:hypothetical protein